MRFLPFAPVILLPLSLAVVITWSGECYGQGNAATDDGSAVEESRVEAAIANGSYVEALALLESVDSAAGTDSFLLRWKAFCLIAVERYEEALVVADRILQLDSGDSYAAFYRAQALAGLEKMEQAAKQLAAVIENDKSSAAALLIESELPDFVETGELPLIAMEPEKRLSASLSLGVGYDDNVALVPEGGGLASGRASSYVQSLLSIDYKAIDQHDGNLPFSLSFGGGFYRSQYLDNGLDEFDYMILDPRLNLRHDTQLLGHDLALELGGFYRKAWFGDSAYYGAWGITTSIDYAITPGVHARVTGEWTTTAFDGTPDFPAFYARDGETWSVTAALSAWTFNNRVWLNMGYTYEVDDASGIQLSYQLHRGFTQAYINLPAEFQLGLGIQYGNPEYRYYIPEPNREDEALELFASLQRHLFVPELIAAINYTRIRNRSNQSFADYDRNILLFQISYTY